MATIFPADPQVNDEYQGYRYNGTSWDIIGIDLTADYQPRVTDVSDTEIGYLDGVTSSIQTQIDSKSSKYLNLIPAKTSNYTISSGDEVSLIELNGTFTVSIPTDSTFNFPIGSQINILNIGTGVITIAAVTPGTTTVNATPGLKLRTQWSSATLIKRAANTWVVIGDLIA
jgi:hypothetical protein